MTTELTKRQKKEVYGKNLVELMKSYNKILLVQIDNVGAFSIQKNQTNPQRKGNSPLW